MPPLRAVPSALPCLAIVILATFLPAPWPGADSARADWSPDFRVTNDPALSVTEEDGGRNVIVDDQFVMTVWSDTRHGNSEIYFRERISGVWQAEDRLTTNAASSTHPAIGRVPGEVRVVWEDDRTGHAEIWTKRKELGAWTPDSCLTCDGFESARPALDATGHHLAWEETKDGNREIHYRQRLSGGAWDTPFRVSMDGAESSHPTIATPARIALPGIDPLTVILAWQDARDGNDEIYARLLTDTSGWGAETRVSNDPGSSRFPSVAMHDLGCGDVAFIGHWVAWQDDRHGNDEIYFSEGGQGSWGPVSRLTTTSSPSRSPSVAASFRWIITPFGVGPCYSAFVAWEEAAGPGSQSEIRAIDLGAGGPAFPISNPGAAGAHPSTAVRLQYLSSGVMERHFVAVWSDSRPGNPEIYFSEDEAELDATGAPELPGAGPGSPRSTALRLGPPHPNPTAAGTSFVIRAAAEETLSVRVVDAAGRRVRSLYTGPWGPGARTFTWDGVDSAGRLAAAGVYRIVAESESGSLARPVTLLR